MSTGLLFDDDAKVAQFCMIKFGLRSLPYDRAVGLVRHGHLIGGIIFQFYNGFNINMSYYGENTLTPGIVRTLARFGSYVFDPSRVTVTTSKRNKRLIRSLCRIGFALEGSQRRYYGVRDCMRSTAVRLVMFRERIDQLAGVKPLEQRPTSHAHGPSPEPKLRHSSH